MGVDILVVSCGHAMGTVTFKVFITWTERDEETYEFKAASA